MNVTIVQRGKHRNPVKEAIQLCAGLDTLKASDKVLIKPNLVIGANKKNIPPFGIVTTSRIIEDLAQALHDYGCTNITVGEGTAVLNDIDSNTTRGFQYSGISRAAKQYNLKLVDFESNSFKRVELNEHIFNISECVLNTDFLINVPVLKTHGITKVSLGMKNLKGCLKYSSKKLFHQMGSLERLIALLNLNINSNLTIIDGTYALEKGPTLSGKAHKKGLIIAGKDILEVDMVGSAILGKDPKTIRHLQEYAKEAHRVIDLDSVAVKGLRINDVAEDLPWEFDLDHSFKQFNITGYNMPSGIDESICSGCLGSMEIVNTMFAKDNPGMDLANIEICIGKNTKASTSSKTFLIGNCAIKANEGIENCIKIEGCPPAVGPYLQTFFENSLDKRRARRLLFIRLLKNMGFRAGLYHEDFGLYEPYQSEEFDLNFFR